MRIRLEIDEHIGNFYLITFGNLLVLVLLIYILILLVLILLIYVLVFLIQLSQMLQFANGIRESPLWVNLEFHQKNVDSKSFGSDGSWYIY